MTNRKLTPQELSVVEFGEYNKILRDIDENRGGFSDELLSYILNIYYWAYNQNIDYMNDNISQLKLYFMHRVTEGDFNFILENNTNSIGILINHLNNYPAEQEELKDIMRKVFAEGMKHQEIIQEDIFLEKQVEAIVERSNSKDSPFLEELSIYMREVFRYLIIHKDKEHLHERLSEEKANFEESNETIGDILNANYDPIYALINYLNPHPEDLRQIEILIGYIELDKRIAEEEFRIDNPYLENSEDCYETSEDGMDFLGDN